MEGLIAKAGAAIQALPGREGAFASMPGAVQVKAAARMLHDTVLAAFNFGYKHSGIINASWLGVKLVFWYRAFRQHEAQH